MFSELWDNHMAWDGFSDGLKGTFNKVVISFHFNAHKNAMRMQFVCVWWVCACAVCIGVCVCCVILCFVCVCCVFQCVKVCLAVFMSMESRSWCWVSCQLLSTLVFETEILIGWIGAHQPLDWLWNKLRE